MTYLQWKGKQFSMNNNNIQKISGLWSNPAVITKNNFIHKSLSNWSFNTTLGCAMKCPFCSVPSTSAIKQGGRLKELGVQDPDSEWGRYVFVRDWDEKAFLASLRRAERIPLEDLKPDGNRAVIMSSTMDPYQVIPDRELHEKHRALVRRALELILERSTLRVRILTRGLLAREDFDLFKAFGNRLLFGMSIPTLDPTISRIYEPGSPAPLRRVETLKAAREKGINVYVAMAPTPPESDEADLRKTIRAIREVDPVTLFHEPINLRAENVRRIRGHAESLGLGHLLKEGIFEPRSAWRKYAIASLRSVERIARDEGLGDRLHLWPDANLGSLGSFKEQQEPELFQEWLLKCWGRISEWPI